MHLALLIVFSFLLTPSLAQLYVTPSTATVLKSSSEIFIIATTSNTPTTWSATLSFANVTGGVSSGCSFAGTSDCTLTCQSSGPGFNCSCPFALSGLTGDTCIIYVASISDGVSTNTTVTQVATMINASLAVDSSSYSTVVLSQVPGVNATILLSGVGFPSSQEEFYSRTSVVTLTVTSFGEASCPSGAISGVEASVVSPGFSVSVSFPKVAVADGCKITAELTRFDQMSFASLAATVVSDLPTISENTSRGIETKTAWQIIDILGSNLVKFSTEIAFSSVSLSWNCPGIAPNCSDFTLIPGGISCNATISSGDRCVLSASVKRLGASSISTRLGSIVTPRSFVPTNLNATVGIESSLLLNLSIAGVLNSEEKSNAKISLVSVGVGCTWSTGGLVPAVFDSANERVNVTISIPATEPTGCSIQASFSFYGLTGAFVVVGTTVSSPVPVSAPAATPTTNPPVAVSAPMAAPTTTNSPIVGSAPVAAPTFPLSPPAAPQAVFVLISGTTFPTSLNLQQMAGGFARVLNIGTGDLSLSVLESRKRAVSNFTIQISFITTRGVAARDSLVASSALQQSLIASIPTSTLGVYSGASFVSSLDALYSPPTQPAPSVALAPRVAENNNVGGIPGGAIAGGVIAAFAGVVIIIFVIVVVVRGKKNKKSEQSQTKPAEDANRASSPRKKSVDSTLLIDRSALVEMEAMERAKELQRAKDREEEERDEREELELAKSHGALFESSSHSAKSSRNSSSSSSSRSESSSKGSSSASSSAESESNSSSEDDSESSASII